MKRNKNSLYAVALAAGLIGALPSAVADENVMIVFDGSNSMWGQIDGTAKIEIARDAMDNLLGEWTETHNIGLMAYGHRRRGDCTDIEMLVTPGEGTRAGILEKINGITPTGKTPLTGAIELAATTLSYADAPATVVLISDGLESCDRDPCAVSEALEQAGVAFTAHVVGFDLGDADASALSCIAENTGGQYLSARNADELGDAFSAVSSAVAAAPEPEAEREPEYDVSVSAPDTALAGSAFDVSWTGTVHSRDFVTIVPMGAEAGTRGNYFRVGEDDGTDSLKAPAETGLYEVRYVLDEGRRTVASQTIEVTEPEVTVSAPDSALAGSAFDVSWTSTVNYRDFVTIVPMGADAGTRGNYFRVGKDDGTDSLKAPAETGLYEVRYVLDEGRRTVASQTIEVTEPEVTVSAPDSALAGSAFDVSWTGTVNYRDFVTIVPMGADAGTRGNYFRVGKDDGTDSLKAPAETGLYEVRYVLDEGRRTVASQTIEVTEPEVALDAPVEIRVGDTIRVEWTGAVHPRDYVTIVPMGADAGTRGNYFRVGEDDGTNSLKAPAETGLYEVRYVLNEGKRVMARKQLEVLAADSQLETGASLSAPRTAAPGETIEIGWTVDSESADQRLTVARADQAIFTWVSAVKIAGDSPVRLVLPSEAGDYELRFLDVTTQTVLARKVIKVE